MKFICPDCGQETENHSFMMLKYSPRGTNFNYVWVEGWPWKRKYTLRVKCGNCLLFKGWFTVELTKEQALQYEAEKAEGRKEKFGKVSL